MNRESRTNRIHPHSKAVPSYILFKLDLVKGLHTMETLFSVVLYQSIISAGAESNPAPSVASEA